MRDDTIRELYEVRKDLIERATRNEFSWPTAFESLYLDAARKLRRVTDPTAPCEKCGHERAALTSPE